MFRNMNGFKRAWIKWLKSGAYKQGKSRLCVPGKGGDEFCCLGVGGNLLIEHGHPLKWQRVGWSTGLAIGEPKRDANNSTTWLDYGTPVWLREWLNKKETYKGGKTRRMTILAKMNDEGESFETIAEQIAKWD